jgi:hypothetical protein
MARGWASKSVEAQQAEAAEEATSPSKIRLNSEQIVRLQKREGLILSRKSVLQQLRTTENPRRRQLLENALADLDAKIADLE